MSVKPHLSVHATDLRQIIADYRPIANARAGILGNREVRRTFYHDMLELLIEAMHRESEGVKGRLANEPSA